MEKPIKRLVNKSEVDSPKHVEPVGKRLRRGGGVSQRDKGVSLWKTRGIEKNKGKMVKWGGRSSESNKVNGVNKKFYYIDSNEMSSKISEILKNEKLKPNKMTRSTRSSALGDVMICKKKRCKRLK